jgi:hypothetical protein
VERDPRPRVRLSQTSVLPGSSSERRIVARLTDVPLLVFVRMTSAAVCGARDPVSDMI